MMKIITPGIYSSIQDLGRRGYRKFGMPLSGAMDQYALIAANNILGNLIDEAAIEITGPGFSCEFNENTDICVTGADLGAVLKNHKQKISIGVTIKINKGDILFFSESVKGLRAYLQVKGGIKRALTMNSKSMFKGERLSRGELIGFGNEIREEGKDAFNFDYIKNDGNYEIRVKNGPDASVFPRKFLKSLLSNNYSVSLQYDRMGIRLKPHGNIQPIKKNILSKPVFPGCIQIPGNGKPIIIMNDGQTTGGYPVWAVIIKEDLRIAGQLKAGDKVKFICV